MNKEITPVKTPSFIGPPAEADAAMDVPVPKPAKRKKLITTITLTMDTCRWPLGDPAESNFHYCGKRPLIGQPYCEVHDARSYQGARRKKTAA